MCNTMVLCRGLEEVERRGGREGEVRLEVVGEVRLRGEGRGGWGWEMWGGVR